MNRRAFLQLTTSAVALGPALTGCGDAPLPEPVDVVLTKGPWITLMGPGVVRLRFETLEDVAVPVVVHVDGERFDLETSTRTESVTWGWGFEGAPTTMDEPGEYTVHDVLVEGIPADATVDWELRTTDLPAGTARPNPSSSSPIRVVWLADTMFPTSQDTTALARAMAPDLLIHGGDFQYRSNPADTWTTLFELLEPLLRSAPFQVCIGNHEFDAPEEATELYDRLFSGQGNSDERWHAFTFGPLHVLMLDSESGALDDPEGPQVAWADTELAAAVADGLTPILAFHRPTYSLSKHWRADTSLRDAVHTLATRHGVQLVLAGHVHGYERFVVDDVQYVVDGGGGALTYDLEEGLAEVEAARPGESELRVTAERTYGCTEIIVDSGTVTVTRTNIDGETTDSFSFTRS